MVAVSTLPEQLLLARSRSLRSNSISDEEVKDFIAESRLSGTQRGILHKFLTLAQGSKDSRDGWDQKFTDKKDGFNGFLKDVDKSGAFAASVTSTIPCPPLLVLRCFADLRLWSSMDHNLNVHYKPPDARPSRDRPVPIVARYHSKMAPIVSSREFIGHGFIVWTEDGFGVCLVHCDAHLQNTHQPQSKHVLGTLYFSGWVVQPVPGDPNQSIITGFSKIGIGGSIPNFIVNNAVASVCTRMGSLKEKVIEWCT
eukprot:180434_1